MSQVVLITGGCRSGKSAHALRLAESLGGERVYVATCLVTDEEMRVRIDRHRRERQDAGWDTVEEPTDVAGAILRAQRYAVVLVDCLTLWVNNVMHEAAQRGVALEEHETQRRCDEILDACRQHRGAVIFVTNEVGMGIVPDNPAARRYRDLIGRCNQVIAAGADEVTLLACGVPLTLKKGKSDVAP
jgi:adenosylcobinamide kinase/adenosylcobinamide-phosphate guanylyltransferase